MKKFSTALTREKFSIIDPSLSSKGNEDKALTAMSNRMVVELLDDGGKSSETFVIRGQNMHSTVKMTARIVLSYEQAGPLLPRAVPFDFEKVWDSIIQDYEYAYNPQRWIAIYNDGKVLFESGKRHLFLDMIEKCDIENDLDYDFAVPMAEEMLAKTGKPVKIDYDANVALNVSLIDKEARCGIILRGTNRTTTFSFTVRGKSEGAAVNAPPILSACAAFLEAMQLAFSIGFDTEKIRLGIIERHSKEEKKVKHGMNRLQRLLGEISNLENNYEVRYRPEKPSIPMFLTDAEELAKQVLTPPPPKISEVADAEEDEASDVELTQDDKNRGDAVRQGE